MKKRVSIYIEESVWEDVKECAWLERVSASALTEEVLRGIRTTPETIRKDDVGDYLEGKVGQIKEELVGAGFFNPVSKDRQLGKKGTK